MLFSKLTRGHLFLAIVYGVVSGALGGGPVAPPGHRGGLVSF